MPRQTASQQAQQLEALAEFLGEDALRHRRVLSLAPLDENARRQLERFGAALTTLDEAADAAAGEFDIVLALGLLQQARDPQALLHQAGKAAPIVCADVAEADEVSPVTDILERMGRAVARIDRRAGNGGPPLVVAVRREERYRHLAPLLVHVHIPKCAGSTFKRLLSLSFGDRHLDTYSEDPLFVFDSDDVAEKLRAHPGIVSIASHSIRAFPPLLGNRAPLYVTFLRDPAAQFLSYITYLKKVRPHLTEKHRPHVPPGVEHMTIRDIADWLVTNEQDVPFKSNYTVKFLAERAFRDLSSFCDDTVHGTPPSFDELALDLALEVLEGFFFVGLVEEMEKSVHLLRAQLQPYGLQLKCDDFRQVNVSGHLLGDMGWLSDGDAVGHRVLRSLEMDYCLYNHVRSTLQW